MAVSAFNDSRRSHHAEVAQINITPLVDVMLVLLVIFMVATPMMAGRIDMRLPGSIEHSQPTQPPPRIELRADGAGRFVLDGVALTRGELPQALRQLAQAQPRAIVEIATNAEADYEEFAWSLAEARHSGLRDIALK